jgi:predicted phage terminase large subunit-like protein
MNARVELDPLQFLIQESRTNFAAFVSLLHRPRFKHSGFSVEVCKAIDAFVADVIAGKRPVLMLTAPPQHGKSSLISRCLPPYLFGRLHGHLPAVRIAGASYALALARRNTRDARSIMGEPIYREVFPAASLIGFKGVDNSDGFDVPNGGLRGVGVGGSLTGFSIDVGIVDDATRDAQAALSPVVQDGLEAWYESVLMTRLQARSGTVIIGTPWSANDLLARVRRKMDTDQRFTLLSFPALNKPTEIGYNPDLPEGALVPYLHDETKLLEMKKHMSEFWWSAMFQQVPLSEFGAIFKKQYLQYYRRADLPTNFQRLVISVDATFKDGQASDYVCAGVWGFTHADQRAWLLDFRRAKLAFMATAQAITDLKQKHPRVSRIYIEDAANGAALIDMLRKHFAGLEGVPPLGSKEARAAAVSWAWENGQVMLPHPDEVPGITPLVAEITTFPDTTTGHDDAVDMMTIALHQLMLRSPIASMITKDILNRV